MNNMFRRMNNEAEFCNSTRTFVVICLVPYKDINQQDHFGTFEWNGTRRA
jgi:hypothetical protein